VVIHSGLSASSTYDTTGIGPENDAAMLARIPDAPDLVIVGHTHNELRDSLIGRTHFTQPNFWAQSLSVTHVLFERVGNGRWKVISVNPQLIPLADVPDAPFARAEAARLDELRLGAVEDRIDADLALGRHADVAGELEALVNRNPLRERLRSQLMLALYRSGRQADALSSYREFRAALDTELGLEPSPRIRELEGRILRSPHPYAEVVSIDTARASRMPGVRAVITSADFPKGARYIHSGGETSEALRQLGRLATSGTEASSALSGLARHFLQLHGFAAATARGTSPEQAVKSLRPRPHFKREPAFITHSRKWGTERLLGALPLIQDAVKRSRLHPDLEKDFAERLVLTLHHKAA